MRVLVTGASGFIGRAIVERLRLTGDLEVRAAIRRSTTPPAGLVDFVRISDLAGADWGEALQGVDAVIHTAARVHVMRDAAANPLAEFRRVNVTGTLSLARQAVRAGVRRFVFISSIKVNGEARAAGRTFTAAEPPAPVDPYGISKAEAEDGLRAIAMKTGLEVVIIRPVLVYGPGVKGNFHSLLRWLRMGLPLPFGSIRNRRSFVALDNLVDLVLTVLRHPNAANRTFLVSDDEDLSTPELLRRAAASLGVRARLVPVPAFLIEATASLLGRSAMATRLCGSLQVDISDTREILGWSPPCSVDEALARTAEAFLGGERP